MDNIDKIIERIKKAVRLANKTTEAGERETALRLARNLAEKNGIAFDDIEVEQNAVGSARQVEDEDWKATDTVVDGRICQTIRTHFAVVMMMTIRKSTDKVRFTYFGCSLNIDIAKYAADILRREAQKAWREVKKAEKDGTLGFKLKRADFMAGWFWKIHKKLTEHPIRNDVDQVEAEKKKAEDAFKRYTENNQVNERKQRGGDDAASLYHGFMKADRVSLNRPCGNGAPRAGEIRKQEAIGYRG